MKDHAQGGHSPLAVYDLLVEADLTAYHSAMQHKLKVHQVDHLRFVTESDLQDIGMSRPEQRRFLKIYQKHFPDSYIGRLRQKLLSRVTQSQGEVAGHDDVLERGSIGSLSSSKTGQHIIPSESISLCQQLGCGEFASVWQGIWSMSDRSIDKIQVAVKKILPEKMHANPLDFLQEAAIMHRVDHEHIVRFYGVVLNPKSVMLVTELAPLRSLAECLRQPNFREALTVVRLCDYAEQVCSGMAYLEENRLIHRDLAARNILVFSLSQVKVADFGLSRALGAGEEYYHSNISVNLKLPIAWCAPECIVYLRFTSASDIWSFGVTLWEMFTYGFQPWAGLTGQQILDCINVPRSRRLDMPDLCPSDYYNLMLQCWEHEPGNRPKFSSLVNLLPDVRPEQVRAIRSCEDGQSDHLQYKADTVITVLNKRPREYPDGYYWKGVLNTGRAGLFLPETTISLLNSECPSSINGAMLSPSSSSSSDSCARSQQQHHHRHHHQGRLLRWPAGVNKVLLAKARPKCPKSNSRPVISAPSSDLRHTGHVGSDGTYFGDVAFLNSAYRDDNLPKLAVAPTASIQVTSHANGSDEREEMITNSRKERFGSISSETALLLNYEIPAACNAQLAAHSKSSLDNSGSLLDEVFEALQQANLGFVDDSPAKSTSKSSIEKEPSTVESPVEICCSERRHLIEQNSDKDESPNSVDLSSLSIEQQQSSSKLKPLSYRDTKMLNDLTSLAVELADKAMREQNEALRNLANGSTSSEGVISKGVSSPLASKKKLYESLLRFKGGEPEVGERPSFCSRLPPEGEVKLSAESEKAYKSMVEEGLACCSSSDSGKSCQPKASEVVQTEEEAGNSLHMLRDDGAAVLRLLRASSRKPPCVAVPKAVASSFRSDCRKGSVPPPVPPRCKERRRSIEDAASGGEEATKIPPPVPPKAQVVISKGNVNALRSQFENYQPKNDNASDCLMTRSVIVESSSADGRQPADVHFTMESVDKYELLDFVLSSLPNENQPKQAQ
ncbi:hypothetical protein M513_06595 [Trichuris suis]|uniref:non-specific protein-tyrosine kinase n=1 Tax=Trichuris suis TaxID=68888 RepID=A0A085M5R5_9BILA|nr:hypothetical protein M513_06595 [Trichuris suis]